MELFNTALASFSPGLFMPFLRITPAAPVGPGFPMQLPSVSIANVSSFVSLI